MGYTGTIALSAQDVYAISSTKQMALGSRGQTQDGRVFRYGLAGAADLAAGKVAQIPAVVANHQNDTVATATVVGDRSINITLAGNTATTLNQYADGYLIGYDASGTGQALQISGNPVIAGSGTGRIQLADPIAIAQTTSGKVNLELSPYAGAVISSSGDTTESVVGVPNVTITAAFYGWFQTEGVAAVLGNGTITKGAGVIKSGTTAGAVDIEATGTITTRIGVALQTGTSTKYNTVLLNVPGFC